MTEPVGPWTRVSRRVGYQNPWITVFHDEVLRPDGSPGIYGVVHFENTAVGVVAIDDQDRVALVAQHRYPLDHRSWEIPEGGAPPGESPLAGAQRELREEAGVVASDWREIARAARLQLGHGRVGDPVPGHWPEPRTRRPSSRPRRT